MDPGVFFLSQSRIVIISSTTRSLAAHFFLPKTWILQEKQDMGVEYVIESTGIFVEADKALTEVAEFSTFFFVSLISFFVVGLAS